MVLNPGERMKQENVVVDDKPVLLKAIELILANPADIQKETKSLIAKFKAQHPKKTDKQIRKLVVDKIISNYSYYAAFSGAGTGLTGIVPGLGTAIAAFGGAATDAALCMKYQVEMTMALASAYGHDILREEEKRLCLIIAGLGTINEAAKEGGKTLTSKAFINMTQQYLKGATLQAVKEIFKKVGLTFTRKALEKSIPFGVGVVIGFSANKGLTWYVGSKAHDFFEADDITEAA